VLSATVPDCAVLHQAVFRALLTVLSQPGRICRLPSACRSDAAGMIRAVCGTLMDHEVTFAVAGAAHPAVSPEDIARWTHARATAPENADFLFVAGRGGHDAILRLRRGSPEMPDTGATVFFLLRQPLNGSEGDGALTIVGPGIPPPGRRTLPALAVSHADMQAVQEANAEFPMGIDCFFLDPEGALIGLPRSVSLRRAA